MLERIAIISFHTCPLSSQEGKETGGLNVFVLETAKQLEKLGFVVDVFTRDQDENSEKVVHVSPNLRVVHLKAGPGKTVPKKQLAKYLPEFAESFADFVKKENLSYKIFDCHYYLSGLAAKEINKILGQKNPIIMTFHTLALMKNLVAKTEDEKEDEFRVRAELELAKSSEKVILTGDADAKYMEYLYKCSVEKIEVITPGVDLDKFYPIEKNHAKERIKAPKDEKIILFVGRIEPLKGIDVLIYAVKILLEKKLSCCISLWIVGGDTSQDVKLWPSELKKLEALRKQLDITSEVKFVGRKKPEELQYYYNSSEVVVMPSQYESFGMTALEAMACAVPVITTDSAGISEYFDKKHESLIIPANNPLLLAEGIEKLLIDETERKKMGQEVRSSIEDLTWEVTANKYVKVYKEILG